MYIIGEKKQVYIKPFGQLLKQLLTFCIVFVSAPQKNLTCKGAHFSIFYSIVLSVFMLTGVIECCCVAKKDIYKRLRGPLLV